MGDSHTVQETFLEMRQLTLEQQLTLAIKLLDSRTDLAESYLKLIVDTVNERRQIDSPTVITAVILLKAVP